ncbi:ABC transporter ATP-binding protein [Cypionkella sp. TWP1-2-1b2]|uniref:ABC transporter ATP-binding protein n=1 Tax=Cypionkella sp. TWP1-2-1b2 TaxID=2804675 RepID=UPI003CE90078
MIRLEHLTKVFVLNGQRKVVMQDVSLEFRSGISVALLGRNGAGKSTLLQMIAGTLAPTSGRIISTGAISWPVGFAGSFHPELTGVQNIRFLARIYGVDSDELVDFVDDFAGLGMHYRLPFRTYSSGMRARLTFGASMGIPFDTYLVDEVTSVGDAAFKAKSSRLFRARMQTAGAFVVSHSTVMVREMCTVGVVLEDGHLCYYEDIEEAIAHHNRNMAE